MIFTRPVASFDRSTLLALAHAAARAYQRSMDAWGRQINAAPDDTTAKLIIAATHWAFAGAQSIEVPHKLAAALMATNARGALEGARMPWSAFELRIPPGLLRTQTGDDVFSVLVSETPAWMPVIQTGNRAGLNVVYLDARSTGHVALTDLAELGSLEGVESLAAMEEHVGPSVDPERYDLAHENRLRLMLARLITGAILLINTARAEKAEAYPRLPLRPSKRPGELRPNVHRLHRTVTIDCAQAVRDYVAGGGARNSPSVTTLVRGHWRQQPHGPRRELRRAQWIEPFWRGDGPLASRTVRLRAEEGEP